jgi:general secretion pathway protein E
MGLGDLLFKKNVGKTSPEPTVSQPVRQAAANTPTTLQPQRDRSAVAPSAILTPNIDVAIPLAKLSGAPGVPRNIASETSEGKGRFDEINRPVRRDPTEKELKDLLSRKSGLLTAPMVDGGIQIDRDFRKFAAFYSDGTLVVDKTKQNSPMVQQVKKEIKRNGKAIRIEYLVDLEVIIKLNENFLSGGIKTKNTIASEDDDVSFRNQIQPRQKEVIALIKEFADIRASDIHININRQYAQIRVRSGGVIRKERQVDKDLMAELFSTAFNMAQDSDSAYRPREFQGARISIETIPLPPPVQAIRLQFNPVANNGKYVVMRLLYENSDQSTSDIDALGYSSSHLNQIAKLRRLPYGINIISGPTGSGKSTTLQNAMQSLIREKNGEVNALTVEDPPEYNIPDAIQMPVVNAKGQEQRAAKFTEAISASLRSDPDIIMIGEIRDESSTNLAFTAALTGHQVWASLHANDAVGILTRLRDNKVEEYKLTDPTLVTGLIGQRLVRKVCQYCSIPFSDAAKDMDAAFVGRINKAVGEYASQIRIPNRAGCPKCRQGYDGRTVVAEVLLPDLKFMECYAEGRKQEAIDSWLNKDDAMVMIEHAMTKMLAGECAPGDVEDRMGDFEQFNASVERRDRIMTMVQSNKILEENSA